MVWWVFLVGLAFIGQFQKACLFCNQHSHQPNQCSPRACVSTCWAPPMCRQHLLLEPSPKILRGAIFFFSFNQLRCPMWHAAYLDSEFARAVWVRARGARLSQPAVKTRHVNYQLFPRSLSESLLSVLVVFGVPGSPTLMLDAGGSQALVQFASCISLRLRRGPESLGISDATGQAIIHVLSRLSWSPSVI